MSEYNPLDKITVEIDEDLEDLIPGFLENRQKDISLILNSLAKNDYKTIETVGHGMKGSGSGYGFDMVSDIGLQLEQAAKENDEAKIRQLAKILKDYLNNVEISFI